jgi:hypothetical protein
MIASALLVAGCAHTSPELRQMSQSFSQRYPDYMVRRVKAGQEISPTRRAVEIEFDAPKNYQNHGDAFLVFDKQPDGSWACVSEDVSMWRK